MKLTPTLTLCVLLSLVGSVSATEPCAAGLQVGQKIGPYSFLVATGPQRGQQTCYVCETGEKPAAVIFARHLSDPLGKLVAACDTWLLDRPKDSARSWLTVLGEKTVNLDDLAKWSKNMGIKSVPTGVFDDPAGPPAFKLNADAEVTVLLWVNRKVVAHFAFRENELNDEALKQIGEALRKLPDEK